MIDSEQINQLKMRIKEGLQFFNQQDQLKLFDTYFEEAKFGYSRVADKIEIQKRKLKKSELKIFEFGSGPSFLALFLAFDGYSVQTVEPAKDEFSFFKDMQRVVMGIAKSENLSLSHFEGTLETFSSNEMYDFVFSINVLEHVEDPFACLEKATKLIGKDGLIFIHCPNYLIPYEPHLKIPLLPNRKIAQIIYKERIEKSEQLWKGLNFITATSVRNFTASRNLDLTFHDALSDAFLRVGRDPQFAARTPYLLRLLTRFLLNSGMLRMLKLLPPWLYSPMEFSIATRSNS